MSDESVWPDECEKKYERIEVVGKGSFGEVWMCKRVAEPTNEFDDEFVAIKNINIKDDKGNVFAEREIRILGELRHLNVVRLIRAFPVVSKSRVVVLQLARGPNLHEVTIRRGALGLPLSRLVSRQLIAAVSYLHGRAVLHRDIKPANCILSYVNPTEQCDWEDDYAIWENSTEAEQAVQANRWKLMLVDFGFARALEIEEVMDKERPRMRNSIAFEKPRNAVEIGHNTSSADSSDAEEAALAIQQAFTPTNDEEDAIMGDKAPSRRRDSYVSAQPQAAAAGTVVHKNRRVSTAYKKVRGMSALGTKAFAAPEIRNELREKNKTDSKMSNAAMTNCVADYGMVVDAYSVGWTLRVVLTGIPPNFTVSEYMSARRNAVLWDDKDDDFDEDVVDKSFCWCCTGADFGPKVRIRDRKRIPKDARNLIYAMIEKKPEKRMTVREAQNSPWITGKIGEESPYVMPVGDYPCKHGDPVVALKCARELSRITEKYHKNSQRSEGEKKQ